MFWIFLFFGAVFLLSSLIGLLAKSSYNRMSPTERAALLAERYAREQSFFAWVNYGRNNAPYTRGPTGEHRVMDTKNGPPV